MGKHKDEKRQLQITESRKLVGNLRRMVEESFTNLEEFKKAYHCIEDLHKLQKEYVIQFNRYQSIGAFIEWCEENKCELRNIKVAKIDDTLGMGVIAKSPIKQGELIMKVGKKCAITASVSRFVDKNLANGLGLAAAVHSEDVSIAIQLCYWAIKIDRCPFAAYIKSLPGFDQMNNLAAVTLADICGIKAYQGLNKFINEYRKIVQQYCKVFDNFEGMDQREWQTKFTLKLWLWAVGNIMSRQNNLSPLAISGISRGLIPLIDFVNFGEQTAVIDFESETDSFVVLATHDIEAGEQVTFAFGSASRRSEILFMHHGIVLLVCMLDDYPLPITFPPELSIEKKRYLLQNIKFHKMTEPVKSLALRIGYNSDHPIHPDLIMFCKVLAMKDEDFASMEDSRLRYFSNQIQLESDLQSTQLLLSFIISYYNTLYSSVPLKKLWKFVFHPSKKHTAQHLCKLLLWKEMRTYQLAAIFTYCHYLLYKKPYLQHFQDAFVMWQSLASTASASECPHTSLVVAGKCGEEEMEIAVDPRDVYACLSYSTSVVEIHSPAHQPAPQTVLAKAEEAAVAVAGAAANTTSATDNDVDAEKVERTLSSTSAASTVSAHSVEDQKCGECTCVREFVPSDQ